MKKKFIALTLITLLVLSFTSISYAGLVSGNDLTSKIADALSEIQSWIVKK